MLCKKPFHKKGASFGCGQCMPCRFNRRRLWTHRMMLEAASHSASAFVTLTYNKEHEPDGLSLVPRDLQLWLKRLRKRAGVPLRYYAVGEYGDATQRPHFHAAVFGLSDRDADLINDTWKSPDTRKSIGYTYTGRLELHSAGYIAGYVTKKMTKADDPRLNGRHPEFARMSLRPGIGAISTPDIASGMLTGVGRNYIESHGDVSQVLRHSGRTLPLGRYLTGLVRKQVGLTDVLEPITSPAVLERQQKMRSMYQAFLTDPKKPASFAEYVELKKERKRQQIARKLSIYRSGKI